MTSADAPAAPASLLAIFWQPSLAFRAVRARPRLLALSLTLACASAAPAVVFVSRADLAQVVEERVERSGRRLEELPAEARTALRTRAPRALAFALPLGAVGKRLAWVGLLATLAFASLRGSRPALRWRQAAAAVGLATMPLAIADLMKAALFATQDLRLLDAANPLLANPAAWLSWSSEHDRWGALLARLDFFQLWSLALASLGLRVVAEAPRSRIPGGLLYGTWALLAATDAIRASFSGA